MSETKTIVFFPEAAFGPALNSVAIAQACRARGHRAVFISDPGFTDVFVKYGFEAVPVAMSEPMPAEQMARYWSDFINGHIPNFRKSPFDQIDNYVKDCWDAIVDTAVWAEKTLPDILMDLRPTSSASTTSSCSPLPSSMAFHGFGSFPAAKTKSPTRTFHRTFPGVGRTITRASRPSRTASTR